jgi:hypothetical protein
MSTFVTFESRWISLAEHSCSSFAFASILCVQVRIFLLPVISTRVVSGRSIPIRVGFLTGTCRHRSIDEGHSLLGRKDCA